MKELNKRKIKIAIRRLTNLTLVRQFIQTDYSKIGIFIDVQCDYTDSITSIFSEVLIKKNSISFKFFNKKVSLFYRLQTIDFTTYSTTGY